MLLDGINHTAACAIERIADAEIKRLEADFKSSAEAAKDPASVLRQPYFANQREELMVAIKQLRELSAEAARVKWSIVAGEKP